MHRTKKIPVTFELNLREARELLVLLKLQQYAAQDRAEHIAQLPNQDDCLRRSYHEWSRLNRKARALAEDLRSAIVQADNFGTPRSSAGNRFHRFE